MISKSFFSRQPLSSLSTLTKKTSFILLYSTLFFPSSNAVAQTFCVQDQETLQQAFATALINGEDDLIRIVQNSKLDNIEVPSEIGFLIRIEGGFTFNCIERLETPKVPVEPAQKSDENKITPPPQQNTSGPVPPPGIQSKIDIIPGSVLAGGSDVTVIGVPSYIWRHGCGSTALGMVVGYWDGKGYDDLYDGIATTQSDSVNQGIASEGSSGTPRHYEDYSLEIDNSYIIEDRSELPAGDEHTSDSIADFMYTSWSSKGNQYGWSWSNHITPAFTSYVHLRNSNYNPATTEYYYSGSPTLTWSTLTTEINAGRPMVFLVDSNSDGYTDHFVTIVGYRLDGSTQYYGCYNTWDNTIHWERFRSMSSSYAWGIWGGYSFNLTTKPYTFPWTMFLPAITRENK